MARTLSIFRFIELLLGIPLALQVLTLDSDNWGILYLLVIYAGIAAVFFLPALWAFFFRRELRRKAVWVMSLPVGLVVLPVMARNAMAEPLSMTVVLGVLAILAALLLAWAVLQPRKAGERLPRFFFRSRALNALIVCGLALGWITPVAALAYTGYFGNAAHTEQGSPGMGLATVITLFAIYLVALGMASVFAGIWGWIGFRSEIAGAQRALHAWQMGLAVPGLVVGVLVWLWVKSQGL